MKWISVIKQTPNKSDTVLVLLKSRISTVANFDGEFFNEDELLVEDVTHWINIPDLPVQSERMKTHESKSKLLQLGVYSRRLKYAKSHVGLKEYVRPISELINDLNKQIKS